MTARAPWSRRAVWGFLWLALFSALFTAGDLFGIWPQLPPGALQNLDLAAGAFAVAALTAALLLSRRPSA
jgi:hypothetical protein